MAGLTLPTPCRVDPAAARGASAARTVDKDVVSGLIFVSVADTVG